MPHRASRSYRTPDGFAGAQRHREIGRHVVVDDLRLRHAVEVRLGIVVFVDLVDVGDVERAVSVSDAGRHLHALEHGLDRLLAALVDDGVDVGSQERADEQRAVLAPRHLPRLRDATRPQLDLKAGRQLDLLQSGLDLLIGEAGGRRERVEHVGALLLLRLVAHEPVIWRMQPEVFLAGIVVLEFLGAGAGCKQQSRDSNHRRSRDERRHTRLQPC